MSYNRSSLAAVWKGWNRLWSRWKRLSVPEPISPDRSRLAVFSMSAAAVASGYSLTCGARAESRLCADAGVTAETFAAGNDLRLNWILPETYGAVGDGSKTDDTAALNAALAASASAGRPVLLTKRYLQHSGNLIVPAGAAMMGSNFWPGAFRSTNDYTAIKPCIITNPAYTIEVGENACVTGFYQERQGLSTPTSYRSALAEIAAFSGTGITIVGADAKIDSILSIGFSWIIQFGKSGFARPRIYDVIGDATNGVSIDSSGDIFRIARLELFPLLTTNTAWSYNTFLITRVSDNGSGLIRVTVGNATPLATGDTIWLTNVGGSTEANGRWIATVISPTTIDLHGSVFRKTYTSGGRLLLTTNQRSGTALRVTNSAGGVVDDFYVFHHDSGIHCGIGANLIDFISAKVDSRSELKDTGSVAIQVDGNANAINFLGGYTSSQGTNLLVNTSGAYPVSFSNMQLGSVGGDVGVDHQAGILIFNGGRLSGSHVVGSGATIIASGCWGNRASVSSVSGASSVSILGCIGVASRNP